MNNEPQSDGNKSANFRELEFLPPLKDCYATDEILHLVSEFPSTNLYELFLAFCKGDVSDEEDDYADKLQFEKPILLSLSLEANSEHISELDENEVVASFISSPSDDPMEEILSPNPVVRKLAIKKLDSLSGEDVTQRLGTSAMDRSEDIHVRREAIKKLTQWERNDLLLENVVSDVSEPLCLRYEAAYLLASKAIVRDSYDFTLDPTFEWKVPVEHGLAASSKLVCKSKDVVSVKLAFDSQGKANFLVRTRDPGIADDFRSNPNWLLHLEFEDQRSSTFPIRFEIRSDNSAGARLERVPLKEFAGTKISRISIRQIIAEDSSSFCVLTDSDFENPLPSCVKSTEVHCSLWLADGTEISCDLIRQQLVRPKSLTPTDLHVEINEIDILAGVDDILESEIDASNRPAHHRLILRINEELDGKILSVETHRLAGEPMISQPQIRPGLATSSGRPQGFDDMHTLIETRVCVECSGKIPMVQFTLQSQDSLASDVVVAVRIEH